MTLDEAWATTRRVLDGMASGARGIVGGADPDEDLFDSLRDELAEQDVPRRDDVRLQEAAASALVVWEAERARQRVYDELTAARTPAKRIARAVGLSDVTVRKHRRAARGRSAPGR